MGATVTAVTQVLGAVDQFFWKPQREDAKRDARKMKDDENNMRADADKKQKEFKAEKTNVRERKKAVNIRASKRRQTLAARADASPKGGTILTGPQGVANTKIGGGGGKTLLGA